MAAKLYFNPFIPAFSSNGAPVAGAKLNVYLTGTTTRTPIYSDEALTIEHPNPVIADAAGKYPNIYLDGDIVYKVVQTDRNDVPIGDAIDPYIPGQYQKGDKGDPGPANNTYTDLAAFKAQPVTNANSTLITAIGGVNYSWLVGDYSGVTPDDDVYIKADDEALSVGVWKKQAANLVATDGGSNVQIELDSLQSVLDGTAVGKTLGASFGNDMADYRPDYRLLVLQRVSSNQYYIYRKCGADVWERVAMQTGTPGNPLRVGAIYALKPAAYVVANVGSDITLTGSWGFNTSGNADSYIGGSQAYAAVAGRLAEATLTSPNPIRVLGLVVEKRADAGIARITIGGATTLINLLPKDGSGNADVDLYAPSSITKVHIPIASNLPAGSYDVKVEVMGTNTPPSSGTRVPLNGFYLVSDGVSDPLEPLTHAPEWTTGKAVANQEHLYHRGNEYSVINGGGTTGSTPPTHTTGTVSDGGVDLLWIRSSYSSDEQMIRQDTSESEYAGAHRNITTDVLGEWGGDIHGNETLDSLTIIADGVEITLSDGDYTKASAISFKQDITAIDDTDSNIPMFSIAMRHDFSSEGVSCSYVQTALKQVKCTSFYEWMHTVYHYDQLGRRMLFEEVVTPRNGRYRIADSYGNSAIQWGNEVSHEMRAIGSGFRAAGAVGNVTKAPGTHKLTFTVRTSDEAMGFYEKTTSGAYAQVNPSGKLEPDGGDLEPNSGIFTKFYYPSVRNNTLLLEIGDRLLGGGSWTLSAVQE